MNDRVLKQLAGLSITSDGQIDEGVRRYALTRLSRADLKRYVLYLRNVLRDRTAVVRTPQVPDAETKKRMAALFPGKYLQFAIDRSLGAGFQIEYGDNVVKANVKNMIEKTIRQLKEKL
jgi:F0F1-type ATP synthase delta subunit